MHRKLTGYLPLLNIIKHSVINKNCNITYGTSAVGKRSNQFGKSTVNMVSLTLISTAARFITLGHISYSIKRSNK